MKTLFKIMAVAAAFGLGSAAATSQAAAPAQPAAAAAAAPAPAAGAPAVPATTSAAPAASAATPPGGVQPSEVGGPNPQTGTPTEAEVARTAWTSPSSPEPSVGIPDGRAALQDQFSPIGEEAAWFHNWILMPSIAAITLLVLVLLLWVIIRYRRSANPTPSRTTHNTLLEVVWTLVPVLILVVIAVPSIKLLARQYSPPAADLTVKVIGNQWYWEYEYPDHGVQFVSNGLSDAETARRGEPRILGVDERVVVPQGATVKLIVTSNDVIHSFGVPAFWVKMDAVPGRLNETWFRADRPGIYYGQCYELCGARHAYMPIAVEVVTPAQFAAWVSSKGGTMPNANRPAGTPASASPDATGTPAVAPAPQPGVTAGEATETSPAPAGVNPGTATPPVSTQGATNSRRGGSQ
jgi:cytochrome c oxidase subunit 2